MKSFLFLSLMFFSLSLLADEVTCQLGKHNYQGYFHLSLTRILKTSSLSKSNQGVVIKTSKATRVLNYWPGFHKLGIAELKGAFIEYQCEPNPREIKCSLERENEKCEPVLKLTLVKDNSELHRIPNIPNISMDDVLADFIETGICH